MEQGGKCRHPGRSLLQHRNLLAAFLFLFLFLLFAKMRLASQLPPVSSPPANTGKLSPHLADPLRAGSGWDAGSAGQGHRRKLLGGGVMWGDRGRAGVLLEEALWLDGWQAPDRGRGAGTGRLSPGPAVWLGELNLRPSLACVSRPTDSVSLWFPYRPSCSAFRQMRFPAAEPCLTPKRTLVRRQL